jgi:hypothetical protein
MLLLCHECAARRLDGHITTSNYQLFTIITHWLKANILIMNMFHSVPGVPCKNGTLQSSQGLLQGTLRRVLSMRHSSMS